MPSFKDQEWGKRVAEGGMGDEAEARFEDFMDRKRRGYVRYGLNRPPLKVPDLPIRIRYTPDYLTTNALIEVQGFGRDGKFKLKVEKLNSLHWWSNVHDVYLYVWDSANERECVVPLHQIDAAINAGFATLDHFPEGKAYYAISGDTLFDWCDHVAY